MPIWLANTFVGVGTLLNITGIVCAVCALLNVWREYGHGHLFPWIAKGLSKVKLLVRRLIRSRRNVQIHANTATASIKCSASVRATIRIGFSNAVTIDEKVERLIRAIDGIYNEMEDVFKISDQQYGALTKQLGDLSQRVDRESKRLESFSRELVTGDVRLQLLALLLIGVGAVLTAAPAFWQLIVSLVTS